MIRRIFEIKSIDKVSNEIQLETDLTFVRQ